MPGQLDNGSLRAHGGEQKTQQQHGSRVHCKKTTAAHLFTTVMASNSSFLLIDIGIDIGS
jgi:hypothetical protein